MRHTELPIIISNPEIPDSPEGKLALLHDCMAALAIKDSVVEGVTPHHVTQDGAVLLGRALRSQARHTAEM